MNKEFIEAQANLASNDDVWRVTDKRGSAADVTHENFRQNKWHRVYV